MIKSIRKTKEDIITIIIIHVYTGDLPAITVDVMGGPVIIKY